MYLVALVGDLGLSIHVIGLLTSDISAFEVLHKNALYNFTVVDATSSPLLGFYPLLCYLLATQQYTASSETRTTCCLTLSSQENRLMATVVMCRKFCEVQIHCF